MRGVQAFLIGSLAVCVACEPNPAKIDLDADGVMSDIDCDDGDATISPDADETCDGKDNNCDGEVDNAAVDAPRWFEDVDEDGHGNPEVGVSACAQPEGYVEASDDCDDTLDTVRPGLPEVCDELDNDCDGSIDNDATDANTYYEDNDGDTFGVTTATVQACSLPSGYAAVADDCDDEDDDAYPGNDEVCDDVDNDCNGGIDDDAIDAPTWYEDDDGDTYGDVTSTLQSCSQPSGYVADGTDCDDTEDEAFPGNPEVCDGVDNDCNFVVDDASNAPTWYADADADGVGVESDSAVACDQPIGYAAAWGDCDDTDALIGATDLTIGSGTSFDFSDLAAGVSAANAGDVLCVGPGSYFAPVHITKPLKIVSMDGPWTTTIQGDDTNRAVFIDNAGDTTLKGFAIKDASIPDTDTNGGNGAGVLIYQSNNVRLMNNFITQNSAWTLPTTTDYTDGIGGGVAVVDSNGVHLQGNFIANNEAWYGGGVALGEKSLNVTLFDNEIAANGSPVRAGGIGIRNSENSTLESNLITANSAPRAGALSIYRASGAVITSNEFRDNTASVFGAAVNLFENPGVDFVDNLFSGNRVTETAGNGGGGGGAVNIWASDDVSFDGDLLENNEAVDGGGIYAVNAALITLTDVTFDTNKAELQGGGLYALNADTITLNGSTFASNEATIGGGAFFTGAEDVNNCTETITGITITDTSFHSNLAVTSSGAGLLLGCAQTVTLSGTTVFDSNIAGWVGGALAAQTIDQLTLDGVEFSSNSARFGGAAALLDLMGPTVVNTLFTDNSTSNGDGGALYLAGGTNAVIEDNHFENNTAFKGGAVYMVDYNETDAFDGNVFRSNVGDPSSGQGGAVMLKNVGTTAISTSEFTDNSAGAGGALYCSGTGTTFTIASSTFSGSVPGDVECDGCTSNSTYCDP